MKSLRFQNYNASPQKVGLSNPFFPLRKKMYILLENWIRKTDLKSDQFWSLMIQSCLFTSLTTVFSMVQVWHVGKRQRCLMPRCFDGVQLDDDERDTPSNKKKNCWITDGLPFPRIFILSFFNYFVLPRCTNGKKRRRNSDMWHTYCVCIVTLLVTQIKGHCEKNI